MWHANAKIWEDGVGRRTMRRFLQLRFLVVLSLPLAFLANAQQSDPLAQSRELLQTKRPKEAVVTLQSYVQQHPDSAEAHYLLGYALYQTQEATASLAQYTTAAQLRPPSNDDLMAVSADYILLKAYGDAVKWLTLVTQRDPKNQLAWYYLGRALYSNTEYVAAQKAFEQTLQLSPRNVSAETGLGLVYEALGKDDRALSAYTNAIDWQKSDAQQNQQPYLRSGVIWSKQGDPQKALAFLLQANHFGENNPLVLEELGRVYEDLGRHSEAQLSIEKAIALDPDAVPLHFLLGKIYREEGLAAKAREQFSLTGKLMGAKSSTETLNFNLKPSPSH